MSSISVPPYIQIMIKLMNKSPNTSSGHFSVIMMQQYEYKMQKTISNKPTTTRTTKQQQQQKQQYDQQKGVKFQNWEILQQQQQNQQEGVHTQKIAKQC